VCACVCVFACCACVRCTLHATYHRHSFQHAAEDVVSQSVKLCGSRRLLTDLRRERLKPREPRVHARRHGGLQCAQCAARACRSGVVATHGESSSGARTWCICCARWWRGPHAGGPRRRNRRRCRVSIAVDVLVHVASVSAFSSRRRGRPRRRGDYPTNVDRRRRAQRRGQPRANGVRQLRNVVRHDYVSTNVLGGSPLSQW